MRATPITASGFILKPRNTRTQSTAYYIFDQEWTYGFAVDSAHFRARNKMLNLPLVSDGSEYDVTRISSEMIHTGGNIWSMVTYFIDGATLSITDPKDAADIYKRILEHMDAHFLAMRTNRLYEPPPVDDFRQLAEFATAIRNTALQAKPDLDSNISEGGFFAAQALRPTFSAEDVYAPQAPENITPKSVTKMDSIERYLESIGFN